MRIVCIFLVFMLNLLWKHLTETVFKDLLIMGLSNSLDPRSLWPTCIAHLWCLNTWKEPRSENAVDTNECTGLHKVPLLVGDQGPHPKTMPTDEGILEGPEKSPGSKRNMRIIPKIHSQNNLTGQETKRCVGRKKQGGCWIQVLPLAPASSGVLSKVLCFCVFMCKVE